MTIEIQRIRGHDGDRSRPCFRRKRVRRGVDSETRASALPHREQDAVGLPGAGRGRPVRWLIGSVLREPRVSRIGLVALVKIRRRIEGDCRWGNGLRILGGIRHQ